MPGLFPKIVDREDMWMFQSDQGGPLLDKTRHKVSSCFVRKCCREVKGNNHNHVAGCFLPGQIDRVELPLSEQAFHSIGPQCCSYNLSRASCLRLHFLIPSKNHAPHSVLFSLFSLTDKENFTHQKQCTDIC